MTRREFTRKTRREALKRSGGRCEADDARYGLTERCDADLGYGVRFDHYLPNEFNGSNHLDNCRSVCVKCHKYATANDIRNIRKADRCRDKHAGTFWKQKRPFPGSRNSKFKKKVSGEVVLR